MKSESVIGIVLLIALSLWTISTIGRLTKRIDDLQDSTDVAIHAAHDVAMDHASAIRQIIEQVKRNAR